MELTRRQLETLIHAITINHADKKSGGVFACIDFFYGLRDVPVSEWMKVGEEIVNRGLRHPFQDELSKPELKELKDQFYIVGLAFELMTIAILAQDSRVVEIYMTVNNYRELNDGGIDLVIELLYPITVSGKLTRFVTIDVKSSMTAWKNFERKNKTRAMLMCVWDKQLNGPIFVNEDDFLNNELRTKSAEWLQAERSDFIRSVEHNSDELDTYANIPTTQELLLLGRLRPVYQGC